MSTHQDNTDRNPQQGDTAERRRGRRPRPLWRSLLFWLPTAGLAVALILLIATPWGVDWLWSLAKPRLPDTVQVDSVSGRLIGPLELRGVAVTTDTATVRLERASLDWRPSRLLLARVQIADLDVQGLDLRLSPARQPAPAKEPAPLSLDFRAPITLVIEQAQLRDFSLQAAPEAAVERIDRLALAGRWTPWALELDHLDITAPRTGRLTATVDAQLDPRRIGLDTLQINATDGPLRLRASGHVEQFGNDPMAPLQDQLRGAIDAQWTALRWPLVGDAPLAELPEGQLQASGQWDDMTAELASQLRVQGGVADLQANASRQQNAVNADLRWNGLAWPLNGPPQLRAPSGEFRVRGQVDDYTIRGNTRVDVPEQLVADLQLDARGNTEQLAVNQLRVTARDTVATLDGRVAWADVLAAQFTLNAPAVNPAKLAPALADWPGELAVRARGQFRQAGDGAHINLDTLTVDGRLREQETRLTAKAAITPTHVVVPTFDLRALGATATGEADLRLKPSINGQAQFKLRDLDPAKLDARFPGRLAADGALDVEQLPDGTLQITTRTLQAEGQVRDRDVALDADATLRGAAMELRTLTLRSGKTRLEAQGSITEQLNLTARLDSPDLSALWPGLTGRIDGEAQLRGPRSRPHVQATLQAGEVRYLTYRLDTLDLQADVNLDTGEALNVQLNGAGLHGAGVDVATVELSTEGSARSHQLRLAVDATDLDARAAATGGLNLRSWTWSGTLDSGRLVPIDLSAWSLQRPTNLTVGAGVLGVDDSCWVADGPAQAGGSAPAASAPRPGGRVCLTASQSGGELLAQAQVERLNLAYLNPLLPPGTRIDMGMDGVAAFRRTPEADSLAVDLQTTAGTFLGRAAADGEDDTGETIEVAFAPGSIQARETTGKLSIDAKLPLDEDQGRGLSLSLALTGAGQLTERPANGTLDIELRELDFLALLLPQLTDVTGSIDGKLGISGALGEPRFEGGLQLSNGAASVDVAGIDLREFHVDLQARDNGGLEIDARAKSDGGPIRVTGQTRLFGTTLLDAKVTGEKFLAYNTDDAKVYISPDLALKLDGLKGELSGTIQVPSALITPQKRDDTSAVRVADDQVIVGPARQQATGPGLQLRSTVTLALGEDVRVEAFGLKTNITGKITAKDRPGQQTTATGELNTVGGSYKAYGQNLDITRGRLIFAGGPVTEPGLDVKAARYPTEDIEVGVRVRGPLSQPIFELYSTPPMPQQEQLSYLVLGRSLNRSDTGATGAEQAALANAALSLGLKGGAFLGDILRDDFGLDEVQIGAGAGQGNDQAALVLGKYLTPKLFVSYGVGLFTPGQSFRIRYQLSSKWTVKTETGTQTGGDVIYTIER